jgi:acetylglutamate kinase
MEKLHVIKVGGKILDQKELLQPIIEAIKNSSDKVILVHGGGSVCDQVLKQLNIPSVMHEGRRITDDETLKVCTMVYAGAVNKSLVAELQKQNINALGLSGADAACVKAQRREAKAFDYGNVGDLNESSINSVFINVLLKQNIVPVFCSITLNKEDGRLLNTNADSIASALAVALSKDYEVNLHFAFDKEGVLDTSDEQEKLIARIDSLQFEALKSKNIINGGMLPKLENAIDCIQKGVSSVGLLHPKNFTLNKNKFHGTLITK